MKETTAQGFLDNWDKVMGKKEDVFIPDGTLDHVRYGVKLASDLEVPALPSLGIIPSSE